MTALGDRVPTFELPDVQGAFRGTRLGHPAVVFFTSNICPYARAWHGTLVGLAREYEHRGVAFLAVNANDGSLLPEDGDEEMRICYAAGDWGPVPYLRDADQSVARGFGAETTPDVFLLDAEHAVRFRSPPDDDCENPTVRGGWLRDALEALLEGRELPYRPSVSVGCPIKWKGRPAHPPGIAGQPGDDSPPGTASPGRTA